MATAARLANGGAPGGDADRGRSSRPDPSAASRPIVGNLPHPATSFVGREREVDDVARLLATTRLLTLTGAAGCGKTRLALQLARARAGDYADGVWLVELASQRDPARLPPLVAAALGVRLPPDQPTLAALLAALRVRQALLILDNAEHLIRPCAEMAEAILAGCPGIRLLVTSREPLAIAGETTWRVPSLAAPQDGWRGAVEDLAKFAAVALFLERARSVLPGFRLTPHNAPAVAQVCRRLDGLPLALELAAALVPLLSVNQVAARLDDRFRLLTGGGRLAAPRQQTLRATLDWSYDLLAAAERAVLRRLAVFADGWSLEAAEVVCVDEAFDRPEVPDRPGVLELLGRLAAKSLVQVELDQGGEARYRLLETVRQYAWERLLEAGEAVTIRARHRDWFVGLAARAERAMAAGAEQLPWLERLERDHDNLRAALAHCLDDDPQAGLRMACCLLQFWRVRAWLTEAGGWLERLLARAPEPTAGRARALLAAGVVARDQGDFAAAQVHLEAGLALGRALGDPGLTAAALGDLGILQLYLGDHARARRLLEEGHALAEAVGDPRGLGTSLFGLGWLAGAACEFARARALFEASLARARRLGDRWLISRVLWQLGGEAQDVGDYDRARALLDEGLAIAEELAAPQQIEAIRLELGDLARARGDAERAAAHYQAALAIARRFDHRYGVARGQAGLGRAALMRGDLGRAVPLLEESLALCQELEYPSGVAAMLQALGLVAWRRRDAAQAAARLRASLEVSGRLGHRPGIAACLESLAMVAAGHDRPAQAARLLGAADGVRAAGGTPRPPAARPDYDRTLAAIRARLGEPMLAAAVAAGRSLTPEAAIADALACDLGLPPATPPGDPAPVSGLGSLTPRESEVLRWLARGATDQAIAAALSISVKTVNTHVANILGKLGCANRAGAAAIAGLHGIV
jgi:predicted ATPase/DNA-binding CsgD family transcriptional regulator